MMKNIGKKLIAVGLCGAMVLPLAACQSDKETTNSDGEQIVLHILENDTAKQKGYLDELLEAFNKAYADEGIQAVDANMEEYSNLAENGPYGYGPDVLYQANNVLMSYAEDKHILPLSIEDFECYEYVPEDAWDAFKIILDGETYYCGIPVNVQEPMLFYREDMLPQNWESEWDNDGSGVADFLENWNSLYEYSASIREADSSKYGIMSALSDLYMTAGFIFSYDGYVFGRNEDGTYDSTDIGFGKGDAALGAMAVKQIASVMNEECIDDSIKTNRYENVANGTYFCSISTPDTYVLFYDKLVLTYQDEGLSESEAKEKAAKNLKMIELPQKLPADGDLTTPSTEVDEWVDNVVMGGINGYAISAYTEHKEASIKFVEFATSYEMIKTRTDILGIAPTRSDVAAESGDTTAMIFESLKAGRIYLMPSIKAVEQIWTPVQTLLGDIAKDAFRQINGETEKYTTAKDLQNALDAACQNVYDAIYTLAD